MNLATTAWGLALACAATAFAESPFAGTWEENRNKTETDSKGATLTIEAHGTGIRYGFPGVPVYSGPLDGSKRLGLDSMANDTFTPEKLSDRSYSSR